MFKVQGYKEKVKPKKYTKIQVFRRKRITNDTYIYTCYTLYNYTS